VLGEEFLRLGQRTGLLLVGNVRLCLGQTGLKSNVSFTYSVFDHTTKIRCRFRGH
jgi:hypothetical protein